jgi:hypothetical protein
MVALSLKLSASGGGDYWDDADRWLRNCFAEFQLTPEKAELLAQAARAMPVQRVRYNETADRVLQRNVGAFAGWPGVNEWVHHIGIQHCCTGNCTRAIYFAWENVLDYRNGVLRVNLLLNRASTWGDVYSHLPYQGRVELKIKSPCKSVLIRLPEWIPAGSAEVGCRVGDKPRPYRWEGRYVNLGNVVAGDKVALSFPISERKVRQRVAGTNYTFTIKGSTVVDIDPPGNVCPLFRRERYRRGETRWRPAERFVAQEPICW